MRSCRDEFQLQSLRCAHTGPLASARPKVWKLQFGYGGPGSAQHAQQLIYGECKHPEHQEARHLRVPAHTYMSAAKLILEPSKGPLERS